MKGHGQQTDVAAQLQAPLCLLLSTPAHPMPVDVLLVELLQLFVHQPWLAVVRSNQCPGGC